MLGHAELRILADLITEVAKLGPTVDLANKDGHVVLTLHSDATNATEAKVLKLVSAKFTSYVLVDERKRLPAPVPKPVTDEWIAEWRRTHPDYAAAQERVGRA